MDCVVLLRSRIMLPIFLSFYLLLFSTSCIKPEQGLNESDVSAIGSGAPLPVSGLWQGVALFGFKEDSNGKTVPVHVGRAELSADAWKVNFTIDPLGNGHMQGQIVCRTESKKLVGAVGSVTGSGALLLADGFLGGLILFAELATLARCAHSKNGYIETVILLNRSSDFFGKPRQTLDKNIGFAGQTPSLYAAEKECRMLRGVRFVSIQNSSACVGFSDPYAKKLRFIIIPAGKIRAVKVDFEKI